MTEEEKMSPAARAAYVRATFPEVVEQIRQEVIEELVEDTRWMLDAGRTMDGPSPSSVRTRKTIIDWLRSHLPPEAPQDP